MTQPLLQSAIQPSAVQPEDLVTLTSFVPGPEQAAQRQLFGLDTAALASLFAELGEKPYRGKQLAEALYRQRVTHLDEITTLPKALRDKLASAGWEVGRPRIAESFKSIDGTERYLVQGVGPIGSAQTVETVWMPEGDEGAEYSLEPGEDPGAEGASSAASAWKRATICVSSQIGCAVNCQFCLTAKLGMQRNLTPGEIAGQVVAVLERHKVELNKSRVNLVFMGMGEPFLNYDNFMSAVRILMDEVGIAAPRMTVSTSGIVPGILRFAEEKIRPKLAISLNAPNDTVRESIMPINRKWNIAAVLDAVRTIPFKTRERVTFEYVMLGGVTDQPEHAEEVIKLVRRANLPAMINLIAWNPGPGIAYNSPSADSVSRFQQQLLAAGIQTYIRRPRGRDIYAACGQLKRTTESATQ
ncbi:23S rRNA (adenine(2503)-C(2))-methyltransferase RlmN [Acidicapsa ligni]|uniref:23S rRNA (adenine(2503)-C(2))-methyltransferase RlmN n=1 Tax=Acidicapsa ligni TaxID=542300 RepID=UPI0021DFB383|nr:23S rRNA (adenine(2503)-C(2))-methyltransferase RlmN [Acidicapsa ligni]